MPKAIVIQCPACGGNIRYQISSGHTSCTHCGHVLTPDELPRKLPLADASEEPARMEHVETAAAFFDRAPWVEPAPEATGVLEYDCPSCAARIQTEQSLVATVCPYCNNTMVLAGTTSAAAIPSHILPFSLTREEALQRFWDHLQDKQYLPRDFEPEIKHLHSIYVPYYMHDIYATGQLGAAGTRSDGKHTHHYRLHTKGRAHYKGLMFDASSRMPDDYMEALSPFNMAKSKPFSAEYLAGHLAEIPDEPEEASIRRAEEYAYSVFDSEARAHLCSERNLTSAERTIPLYLHMRASSTKLCLLPVWLLHYTWQGTDLLSAINGQTGECVAELPVDKGRRRAKLILKWIPFLVMMALCAYAIQLSQDTGADYHSTIVLILMLEPFIFMFAHTVVEKYDTRIMQQMKTAKKATEDTVIPDPHVTEFKQIIWAGATSVEDAERVINSATCHYGPKAQLMLRRALEMRDVFLEEARQAHANVSLAGEQMSMPNSHFGENGFAVFDHCVADVGGHAYGYYLTDAGLYCKDAFNKNAIFLTWESYAKASEPELRGSEICVDGATVAFDWGQKPLRKPLLELYRRLHRHARSVYLHPVCAYNEQPSKYEARQLLMGEYARNACEVFATEQGSTCLNVTHGVFGAIRTHLDDEVLLAHDDTYDDSGNYGFIISASGFFCKETTYRDAEFISWQQLSELDKPRWAGSCIRAGKCLLLRYTGEARVRDALLKMCGTLHESACKIYADDDEAVEWCMREYECLANQNHRVQMRESFLAQARAACEAFFKQADYADFRDTTRFREWLRLDRGCSILLIHGVETLFGDCYGFAFTESGITSLLSQKSRPDKFSWEYLAHTTKLSMNQEFFLADKQIIAVFKGNESTRASLFQLFLQLRHAARQCYG